MGIRDINYCRINHRGNNLQPAHGSDTSPILPAVEEIWMTAAFSTLRPLLDWRLAARFSRGNKALGKIGEDEEMRIHKSPLWKGLDLT